MRDTVPGVITKSPLVMTEGRTLQGGRERGKAELEEELC